jgi:hypothetical protein
MALPTVEGIGLEDLRIPYIIALEDLWVPHRIDLKDQ